MSSTKKPFSKLNLIDNFLFSALMDHPQFGPLAAEIILEMILGRKVNVKEVHAEKLILPADPDLHGIRLDAIIEEDSSEVSPGEVFDVEPDNIRGEKLLLPRRSRYYHSRMDARLLDAGASYADLPSKWVIFITSFDPFDDNQKVYTIKNRCMEVPGLNYDDGNTTLYLYINGKQGQVSDAVKALLAYFENTTPENAKDPRLAQIQSFVDSIKSDSFMKEAYMTWGEYIQYEREEAVEEAGLKLKEIEEERNTAVEERDAAVEERDAILYRLRETENRADAALREVEELRKKLSAFQNKYKE